MLFRSYDNAAPAAVVGREVGSGATAGGLVVGANIIRPLQLRGTAATDLGITGGTSGTDNTFRNFGWGGYNISPPPGTTTTYLRGDGTWATVTAGGGGTVTSVGITAGTGISVVGSPITGSGSITVTNAGVTSAVAGTGLSVSAGTGAVTFSIGQAVATNSNVQFNSIGVGMSASATAGRIDATNDIVAYSSSDRKLKTNIKSITDPLKKLQQISGNTFVWRDELKDIHGYSGEDVGVIAQEIEQILPQAVRTNTTGYKSVRYEKIIPLLIEAINQQQLQIDKLTKLLEHK